MDPPNIRITRTKQVVLIIGVVAALTMVGGTASAANTVTIGDQNATVGESTTVVVALDDTPEGIQRYNVTVHLDDAEVATVTSVDAGDVDAFQVRAEADDSVTFRAADLSRSVEPGATNVTLGTVSLTAAEPGTSDIGVTVHDFRTDAGEQIRPTVSAGTLTVQREGSAASYLPRGELSQLLAGLPGPPTAWAAGAVFVVGVLVGGLVIWGRSRRASATDPGEL